MISEFMRTKRRKLVVSIICAVLVVTTGLFLLSYVNPAAEASVLTPLNFFDDFSEDLSQWTVVSGTWAIESGELNGDYSGFGLCVAGHASWTNITLESRVMGKGDVRDTGIIFRYQDSANYYCLYINGYHLRVMKMIGGGATYPSGWYVPLTTSPNTWYTLKVILTGNTFEVYFNGDYKFTVIDGDAIPSGKIGVGGYNEHSHFDDVMVSGTVEAQAPSDYVVNVRAGVTQIIVTCTWSGSGNVTITLVSPTTTYYESNMDIYEKSTVYYNGKNASTLNVKRTALSISAPVSSETWFLYLDLSGVVAYQVSVETI